MSIRLDRVVAVGLSLIAACACSPHIEEQEEVVIDQERIDEYCSTSCRRSDDCGMLGGANAYTYETCFSHCSIGEYMRWPDEECQEAMWRYYDCRIEHATSCEVWGTGYGDGAVCDPLWEEYGGKCAEWILGADAPTER